MPYFFSGTWKSQLDRGMRPGPALLIMTNNNSIEQLLLFVAKFERSTNKVLKMEGANQSMTILLPPLSKWRSPHFHISEWNNVCFRT